jgi:hypothetical protein
MDPTDRNSEHHSIAVPHGLIHPDIRDHIRGFAKYVLLETMLDLVRKT